MVLEGMGEEHDKGRDGKEQTGMKYSRRRGTTEERGRRERKEHLNSKRTQMSESEFTTKLRTVSNEPSETSTTLMSEHLPVFLASLQTAEE